MSQRRVGMKTHLEVVARAEKAEADYKLCFKRMSFEAEQHAKVCVERDDIVAQRDAALNANVALRAALEKCLVRETMRAKLSGFSDCTCINISRETEIEYETGRCPHQLARQALSDTPAPDYMAVVEAVQQMIAGLQDSGWFRTGKAITLDATAASILITPYIEIMRQAFTNLDRLKGK